MSSCEGGSLLPVSTETSESFGGHLLLPQQPGQDDPILKDESTFSREGLGTGAVALADGAEASPPLLTGGGGGGGGGGFGRSGHGVLGRVLGVHLGCGCRDSLHCVGHHGDVLEEEVERIEGPLGPCRTGTRRHHGRGDRGGGTDAVTLTPIDVDKSFKVRLASKSIDALRNFFFFFCLTFQC